MSKRRYLFEQLITATNQASNAAPTNALANVAGESAEGLGVYRNATGTAGGLFDFGGAALVALIGGTARPLRCVGLGAIMGGQSAYTCTLHHDASGVKFADIATGTTATSFRMDEASAFTIPTNGQIQFTTTGATAALRLWVVVEDVD